jgi:hypothetical protein
MWHIVCWDWQIGTDGKIMHTFAPAAYINFLYGRIVFHDTGMEGRTHGQCSFGFTNAGFEKNEDGLTIEK